MNADATAWRSGTSARKRHTNADSTGFLQRSATGKMNLTRATNPCPCPGPSGTRTGRPRESRAGHRWATHAGHPRATRRTPIRGTASRHRPNAGRRRTTTGRANTTAGCRADQAREHGARTPARRQLRTAAPASAGTHHRRRRQADGSHAPSSTPGHRKHVPAYAGTHHQGGVRRSRRETPQRRDPAHARQPPTTA